MKVFIIVDALDECQSTDRSRDRHLKISNFKPGLTLASLPRLDLYQELRRDLKEYLLWRLERVVMTLRNTYRALLVDFRDAVDGMFFRAWLHLDSLIGKRSPKTTRNALKSLPTGLRAYYFAYRDAIERIQGQVSDQKEMAFHVLSWISCAERQTTASGVQHALAVEVGEPTLDKDDLPEVEDMISVCAGLVVVDEQSDT
ncbi:hypothetical protein DTO027B5_2941 [Paecilomyces variotii]|nr:hypothetical protein DTO027B3_6074 [Paecilomyces variotii]KAJ9335245.1 hypothetical protein DTO027B5_2941 [Paecilomyces variotii]